MDDQPKVTRDRQVMVRLSDAEYASLLGAASGADRKVADMARVLILRGMDSPRQAREDAR